MYCTCTRALHVAKHPPQGRPCTDWNFPPCVEGQAVQVHSCFTECTCPTPRALPLHKNGQDVSQS